MDKPGTTQQDRGVLTSTERVADPEVVVLRTYNDSYESPYHQVLKILDILTAAVIVIL